MLHIYCITNLINNKKYVGQTTESDPLTRWKGHIKEVKRSNYSIHMAMRKYGIEKFHFEVIDESANNIDELNDLESFYVSFYDTFKGHGYNMTSGGEGYIVSEETKQKMSKRMSGDKHHYYGKHLSDEHKEKIRRSNLGNKFTKEHRQKLSEAKIGKKLSDEHKQKLSESSGNKGKFGLDHHTSKKVAQIDKNTGEEITCWFSTMDIQRELKINNSNISRVCLGKQLTAGGFKWRYADV